MTRIVARLGADDLVQRIRCTDDARGAFAVLTEAGLQRLEQAYPDHLASVRRHVIDRLGNADEAQVASFTALLNSFAADVAADGLVSDCPGTGVFPVRVPGRSNG
jgi:DNA-binding MarR family transcriptional regulator